MSPRFQVDPAKIIAFCHKWKVREFSIFGSVLREDFNPESDVDVLVSFEPDAPWSYFEWADMTDELKEIFGREVDLVEKESLQNPYRRHSILSSRRVLYAA
ncbi:MAG: DNA polymerase subunit beta [Deltaproteobacteria bacterium RBG_13_61_14]|nr:MAG: DNA polymerase subunit beta [Deltaproteobacteria bacterium RBG_13_61_14]